jgi:hypothetical protein
VAELARFLDRELEHALGLRRERHFPERERLGESGEGPLDLCFHGLEPKPKTLENCRRDAFAVTDKAEEDVFSTDEIVAEPPRLLPR